MRSDQDGRVAQSRRERQRRARWQDLQAALALLLTVVLVFALLPRPAQAAGLQRAGATNSP